MISFHMGSVLQLLVYITSPTSLFFQVIDDLLILSYTVESGMISVKAVLKKKAGWMGVGMSAAVGLAWLPWRQALPFVEKFRGW